jgi:hypothetical protein
MDKYLIPRNMSIYALAGFLALIFFLQGSAISANRAANLLPLFCPFEAITHVPCPGCGMTHALFSMAQGSLKDAWLINPFAFFLVFLLAMSCLPRGYLKRQPPRAAFLMKTLFTVALSSLLYHWIVFRALKLL